MTSQGQKMFKLVIFRVLTNIDNAKMSANASIRFMLGGQRTIRDTIIMLGNPKMCAKIRSRQLVAADHVR